MIEKVRCKTTSDDSMNFTGEFLPVKFVYKLPFPWFMYTSKIVRVLRRPDWFWKFITLPSYWLPSALSNSPKTNSLEMIPIQLSPQLTFLTKNLPVIQKLSLGWFKKTSKNELTSKERSLASSLFRIILYS